MAKGSFNKAVSRKTTRPRRPPPAVRRATRGVTEDIAAWRKLRGLTQAQLADRAGIGRATLARLEQGDGGISLESLLGVLRALGILENLTRALDPYESDLGRLRADEGLPRRVRPLNLAEEDDA
jgi:transcriptional regulator with XRE-family HTH domain